MGSMLGKQAKYPQKTSMDSTIEIPLSLHQYFMNRDRALSSPIGVTEERLKANDVKITIMLKQLIEVIEHHKKTTNDEISDTQKETFVTFFQILQRCGLRINQRDWNKELLGLSIVAPIEIITAQVETSSSHSSDTPQDDNKSTMSGKSEDSQVSRGSLRTTINESYLSKTGERPSSASTETPGILVINAALKTSDAKRAEKKRKKTEDIAEAVLSSSRFGSLLNLRNLLQESETERDSRDKKRALIRSIIHSLIEDAVLPSKSTRKIFQDILASEKYSDVDEAFKARILACYSTELDTRKTPSMKELFPFLSQFASVFYENPTDFFLRQSLTTADKKFSEKLKEKCNTILIDCANKTLTPYAREAVRALVNKEDSSDIDEEARFQLVCQLLHLPASRNNTAKNIIASITNTALKNYLDLALTDLDDRFSSGQEPSSKDKAEYMLSYSHMLYYHPEYLFVQSNSKILLSFVDKSPVRDYVQELRTNGSKLNKTLTMPSPVREETGMESADATPIKMTVASGKINPYAFSANIGDITIGKLDFEQYAQEHEEGQETDAKKIMTFPVQAEQNETSVLRK